jgi:hypothetical protein
LLKNSGYIILTGRKSNEGCVLNRNRDGIEKTIYLKDSNYYNDNKFIIQTNNDHWINKVDFNWASYDNLLLNSWNR